MPLFMPLPRADHWLLLASPLAIVFASTPPSKPNSPPTYVLLPLIAITETSPPTPILIPLPRPHTPLPLSPIAQTSLFNPLPRADHWLPSHLAMLFALTPPAVGKYPPT